MDDVYMHGTHYIPKDFYLQNVVKSMIPFYAFYSFAKRGYIDQKWLRWFFIIFFIATIGFYFYKQNELIQDSLKDSDGVTNNVGYIFVSFLPLLCFWEEKRVAQYVLLASCLAFIVLSMKRGAVIISAVCVVYFFLSSVRQVSILRKVFFIFLTILLVFAGYYFVVSLMNTNDYFMSRIDATLEGNSSSRDTLYEYFWNMFLHNSSPVQQLIGRGADGTIRNGYNYAHNDWLEILIDQGVLGIIIFVGFWRSSILMWKSMPRKSVLQTVAGMCIIALLLRTLFSMSINAMSIYSTCVLGVLAAYSYNSELLVKFQKE